MIFSFVFNKIFKLIRLFKNLFKFKLEFIKQISLIKKLNQCNMFKLFLKEGCFLI
jgi:hypothetical protein